MTTPTAVLNDFLTELRLMVTGDAAISLPADWGSTLGSAIRRNKTPYLEWKDPYVKNEFAVLHYGGWGPYSAAMNPITLAKSSAKLRQWELMHTGGTRNWRGIAYGFAIDDGGNIFILRGFNLYGAHRGDFDNDGISANREGMPILWIGGERNHGPSKAAFTAFEQIVIAAENAEGTRYTRIIGHQEIIPGPDTQCPGKNGMLYVRANRTSDAFRADHVAPVEPPVPPPVTPLIPPPVIVPPHNCWDSFPVLTNRDGWKKNIPWRPNVSDMQAQLANRGFKAANTFNSRCQADGLFGDGTEASLKAFQRSRNLPADGACGPSTWKALNNQ